MILEAIVLSFGYNAKQNPVKYNGIRQVTRLGSKPTALPFRKTKMSLTKWVTEDPEFAYTVFKPGFMSHHKLLTFCVLCSLLSQVLLSLPSLGQQVDLDGNGLDDFWEQNYNAGGLIPGEDSDYDGMSNAEEDKAGTNPLDRHSKLEITSISITDGTVKATFDSQPGKRYRLRGGNLPDGSDFNELGILGATTEAGSFTVNAISPDAGFFEITVEDIDSDGDGLSDWSELLLDGYDPDNPHSWSPDFTDREILIQSLQSQTGEFQVTATQPEAFEKGANGNPSAATVSISRTGGIAPVTVFYSLTGSTDPEKEAASATDYQAVSGMINFINGQTSAEIQILPVADTQHEFPNSLVVSLDVHPDYAIGVQQTTEVTIFDATDDPSNITNFLGQYGPERGSVTPASGYSWLKLNGKKNIALVTSSFSGLTTTQTTAHIHNSTLDGDGVTITNGPVVESLPLGQFVDYVWNLRRTGALSPQDLIDSLFGQNGQTPLYANVHSMRFPGGEIWGFFSENSGSPEFVEPEAPPPIESLSGDDLTRDVQRFLTQATFGAREGEISALVDDINNNHGGDRIAGFEAWIDAQYALDQTNFYDITYAADQQEWALVGGTPTNPNATAQPRQNNRRSAFWHIAMHGHDQLRQRVAFALSEIFVVSEVEGIVGSRHYGLARYYDMLADHSDGNFETILRDVSKHPIMGQYLSSLKNAKAVFDSDGETILIAPDENYAREVMQLFSIGLLYLHPDGSLALDENGLPVQTYDNAVITELARVFTGWSHSKRNGSSGSGYPVQDSTSFTQGGGGNQYFQAAWENPMKNFSSHHDVGEKNLFGQTIPANQTGEDELNTVSTLLATHQNTGPFIARLLIQRLVTSNPSAGYIHRIASVFTANEGSTDQMKKVIKAILLDYEARSLDNLDIVGYGKQKEPLLRYVQLMRALDARSQFPLNELSNHGYPASQMDNFPPDATMIRLTTHGDSWWKQSHLRAPTVFNWFLPDHKVGGALQDAGLVAPEFALTNEYQVIRWVNYAYVLVFTTNGLGARELPEQRTNPLYNDPNGYLDNFKATHTIDDFVTLLNNHIAAGDTERQAAEKILDHFDLLLCGGRLKAMYGSDPAGENPRNAILDQAEYVYSSSSSTSHLYTVRDILYLLATSPEFITQK